MPQSGLDLIACERERQLQQLGWTDAHDDSHTDGSLAMAAACFAAPRVVYVMRATEAGAEPVDAWPAGFGASWDSRLVRRLDTPRSAVLRDDRVRELAKAGALVAAEIDRLQRIGYRVEAQS